MEAPWCYIMDPNVQHKRDATVVNTMGLAGWGIILQFACFFWTYPADLRAASLA